MQYSVLMSVYRNDIPEYIDISIRSILKQTVLPEQFVIVVDGPVPNAIMDIIDNYRKNVDLFTIVELKENKGLGNALNVGLQQCRNELVARMDADDISVPSRCERELECFNKDLEIDICGCNIVEFLGEPENIRTERVVPEQHEDIKKFMRKRQPFNHPTVMYKKSKVLAVGGYEILRRKEDFDLFSKMLVMGCKAVNINESLYLYRANEDNYKRRKSWINLFSAILVYTKHLKRGGCGLGDYIIICGAEVVFFVMPQVLMHWVSDNFLRRKVKNGESL